MIELLREQRARNQTAPDDQSPLIKQREFREQVGNDLSQESLKRAWSKTYGKNGTELPEALRKEIANMPSPRAESFVDESLLSQQSNTAETPGGMPAAEVTDTASDWWRARVKSTDKRDQRYIQEPGQAILTEKTETAPEWWKKRTKTSDSSNQRYYVE